MKRYDAQARDRVEDPKVDAFLAELVAVSRKHGMSLGHEDRHGAFVVIPHVNEDVYQWLLAAAIDREDP